MGLLRNTAILLAVLLLLTTGCTSDTAGLDEDSIRSASHSRGKGKGHYKHKSWGRGERCNPPPPACPPATPGNEGPTVAKVSISGNVVQEDLIGELAGFGGALVYLAKPGTETNHLHDETSLTPPAGLFVASTTTAADGSFTLTGVPLGMYRIIVVGLNGSGEQHLRLTSRSGVLVAGENSYSRFTMDAPTEGADFELPGEGGGAPVCDPDPLPSSLAFGGTTFFPSGAEAPRTLVYIPTNPLSTGAGQSYPAVPGTPPTEAHLAYTYGDLTGAACIKSTIVPGGTRNVILINGPYKKVLSVMFPLGGGDIEFTAAQGTFVTLP